MIFGFGKKSKDVDEEEIELVLFQGALNGKEANLAANAKLAGAGLGPAKDLITDALIRRAETIRIEAKGERAVVTFLVDGIPYPGGRMGKPQAMAITQVMKLLSGLDIKERRKPQSGGVKAEFEERPYVLRVDTRPIAGGTERLLVRAQNLKEKLESPEELGISAGVKQKIRDMVSQRSGVILACGPPGTGTTTTSYGVLRSIDGYVYGIFTIGDTGDESLNNITKFDVQPDDNLETTLTRVIRVEADVVLVDPIRDAETAKTVFSMHEKVALITEFTAKDTATGIAQLIKWTDDAQLVSEGLSGIVTQKLIRRLCTACREAYRPNPKLIKKVGLPEDTKVLYRKAKPADDDDVEDAGPCTKCGGVGFYGRTGMFEFLEMTDAMRELVAKGPSPAEIKALARKEKIPSLQQDGVRLVAEGITSLDELQRVFKAS